MVEIQDYSFDVFFAPGDQLVVADTLSRDAVAAFHCPYCDENVQAILEEFSLLSLSKFKEEQQEEFALETQDLRKREDFVEEGNGVMKKLHRGNPKIIVTSSLK